MEFLKRNYIYLLVIVTVLVGASALLLEKLYLKNTNQPQYSISPTPTRSSSIFPGSEQYQHSSEVIRETEAPLQKQGEKIATLIKLLPYTGNNFKLEYRIADNTFIVTINKNNQQVGNQEFDVFLKSQGIDNQTQLGQISIVYQ